MTLAAPGKSIQSSREELDTISNRVAIALAKREKLIKSWTSSSTREREPEKTQEELDAEDATLFRNEPPYLGVGAPIPSQYLISEAERNNKTLRAKFFPTKGLKASKQRDAEEKAASAKRGLNEESSEDEGGRSSLGKAKKRKTEAILQSDTKSHNNEVKPKVKKNESTLQSLATTPNTPPKSANSSIANATKPTETEANPLKTGAIPTNKAAKDSSISGTSSNPSEGSIADEALSKPAEEAKRDRLRLKKKMKRIRKQNREKDKIDSTASI